MSQYNFCSFRTQNTGKCGVAVFGGGDRCDRHKGKKEKPKLLKAVKFSGDSKWRMEQGMYQAKIRQ